MLFDQQIEFVQQARRAWMAWVDGPVDARGGGGVGGRGGDFEVVGLMLVTGVLELEGS